MREQPRVSPEDPEVREILQKYLLRLKTGELKNEELLIEKSIRQRASEYKVENFTALALRQLQDAGIEIHPGEEPITS